MATSDDKLEHHEPSAPTRFNPLKIIVPVLLALLSISVMSQWYARNVSLPRYCENPETALSALRVLIEEEPDIDNDQRRQYMVAAKLLFLHPMRNNEERSDYMLRIRQLMARECR